MELVEFLDYRLHSQARSAARTSSLFLTALSAGKVPPVDLFLGERGVASLATHVELLIPAKSWRVNETGE